MLRLDDGHSGYGGSEVLHGVSLTVAADSAVSILGRNGAGKTTALRTILGLCKCDRGTIAFQGKTIDARRPDERAMDGLALVPDHRGIFASLNVRENLQIAERPNARWKMNDVYAMFPRLKERERNAGSELSGGEQQMLAIGRALLTEPRLLLLDEPTEGLAPIVVEQIVEVIREVRRAGVAVLIVEQNLDVCLSIADFHYIMEDGQIVHSASSAEFCERTDLHAKFLGV